MNQDNFNKRMSDLENRYNKKSVSTNYKPLSTGHKELDNILNGGIPKGCITEIFGKESIGKTTLGLEIIKQAQKEGLISLYFDCDYSWDKAYAKKIGLDFETLDIVVSKPNEYMLQAIENLIDNNLIDLIIIDTITSLAIGKNLLFNILKRLSGKIKKNNVTVILISQIRHKFTKEETVIYKELMEFYVTLRIHMEYICAVKKRDKIIYKNIRTTIVQNKLDNKYGYTIIKIGNKNE